MSVIGPRPLLVEYLPYYTKEEHHRHDVRPGLSGWAQINGRNAIDSWEQRFQYVLFQSGYQRSVKRSGRGRRRRILF